MGAPVLPVGAQAARWSDPATWGGSVPAAGATVTIPAGRTITLDTRTAPLAGLVVRGTLVATEGEIALTTGYVFVEGGRLEIGTATAPFRGTATITLTGTGTAAPVPALAHFGNKVLAVHGGTLSLHGRPVGTAWTRLAADAPAGATAITVAGTPQWRVGDRIVVASSTRDQAQAEVRQVASIAGSTIGLSQPLQFRHLGTVRRAGETSVDVRAEVGLLSHNIVVQGDDASEATRVGGHAMFMNGATPASVQLERVTFRRMGQLNVTGRYPIHFHLMGASSGSYVRQVAVDGSIQRGLVLHSVSGIEASGNVLFNTVGHNLVVEDERTTGNRIEGNLALVNRQASPLQTTPELVAQNDRLPSNFWFKSGRNVVAGNHAAGSFSSGFNYDAIGGEPIDFRGNVAHAAMSREGAGAGDFDMSGGLLIVSEAPRPAGEVIADYLGYHNAFGIWPEEVGRFVVERAILADNDVQTFNRGVGNAVTYRNTAFVGTLTEPRTKPADIVLFQYGSDVRLESPYFVAHGDGWISSPVDIAEPSQAHLRVVGARGPGIPGTLVQDGLLTTFEDDAVLPRGSYMTERRYGGSDCVAVRTGPADEPLPAFRCPRAYDYAELDVRDRATPTTRQHARTAIRRSDGLSFTGGMFGYTAVLDAGLRYDVQRAATRGHAVRLNGDMMGGMPAGARLAVSLPVAGTLSGVFRSGTGTHPPATPPAASRLREATNAADFAANPLTTFLRDPATGRITVTADARWLVVGTSGTGATVAATESRCTSPRDAAIATVLAHARREPITDVNGDGRRDLADLVSTLATPEAACR